MHSDLVLGILLFDKVKKYGADFCIREIINLRVGHIVFGD